MIIIQNDLIFQLQKRISISHLYTSGCIAHSNAVNFTDMATLDIYTPNHNKGLLSAEDVFFKYDPPARSVVEVSDLPLKSRIEIEAVGYIK